MRPFSAIWLGDREALVPADNRPGVWLPKEPGDDRWELHTPQGMPPAGEVVVVSAGVDTRWDGGPRGRTTRRTVYLYAPGETPQLTLCRTELRLVSAREPRPEPGWSIFDHPDARDADGRQFWRLFRVPLTQARYAATFAAPRREAPAPPERRWVPDPLARYEAMVDDDGRPNTAFEHRRSDR